MKTLVFLTGLFYMRLSKKNKLIKQQENVNPKWIVVRDGPLSGMKLFISTKWDSMANGTYDSFIFTSLNHFLINLEKSIVWDVGAHIGYHSLAFSKLVGQSGKIFSFEPNPFNLERLKINITANSQVAQNITIFDYALSNADEKRQFKINSNVDNTKSSGSFLNYGALPSDRYSSETFADFTNIKVSVYKPDTLITQLNVPIPHFIKLDIEGAEVRFLEGSLLLLDTYRSGFMIEVHNIQNMFKISEIFFHKNYQLILLDDQVNASSRCFILALPN